MLYSSYADLIGETPLVRLGRLDLPEGATLWAKLELANPGGSVKDRIGRAMIDDAERRGALRPGGTIVEGTAGNTGIGIAFAAIGRGYRVVFVVPDKFSGEKVALLRALGAEIVRTPRSGGMLLAERRADEIAAATPGAVVLGQFRNPANPRAHYETTGPEIWRDLGGGGAPVGAGGLLREDGRLDASLREAKENALDRDAEKIFSFMQNNGGTMNFHDKPPPQTIKAVFKLSKAAFKRAVGHLYHQRRIDKIEGGFKVVEK